MDSYPAPVATIVLVHGFTQNRMCWGSILPALGRDHDVIAVDAPGHGQASDVRADLWQTSDLLATNGRATFVGYSMGARMALHVALSHPDLVDGLALVSGTAGIEDPTERAARVERDEALARSLERDGLDAFLARWLEQPLFATLPPSARDDGARRANTVDGLASSLRLAGTGTQDPLWDRLDELTMPVLVVSGGLDERFTIAAHRMSDAIGANATLRVIADAGHACHREREPEFSAVLREWLGQDT
jgi:2-succinyl-6-hydroxy-2,4-cyclohexadiene-1-carboxylate synthase